VRLISRRCLYSENVKHVKFQTVMEALVFMPARIKYNARQKVLVLDWSEPAYGVFEKNHGQLGNSLQSRTNALTAHRP